MKSILMVFLFLTVSFSSADEKVVAINAGVDQQVVAGDTVNLAAVITFANDEDEDKKDKKHKKRKDKKDKKHKKHKKHKRKHKKEKKYHKRKHEQEKRHYKKSHDDDDDDDNNDNEIVIQWSQVSGTPVDLINANTLTPSFTIDAALPADEVLVFTVTVTDDGEVIASDSVAVSATAMVALTSQVGGRVTAVDGTVLANVSIDVLSAGASVATLNTDINGQFALDLDPDSNFVLVLTANGYANQVIPVKSPALSGSVSVDISMIARGALQSFNAGVDSTLVGADGAAFSLLANSFVDANGNIVTGNIDVTITPVDVSRPAALAAFPGEFSGVVEGATVDTPIISFGTVEYHFTQNGQPVQLATGMNAGVLIPIYIDTYQDGTPIQAGDSIPLWSLDEVTGIWTQEGVGQVINSVDSPTGLMMFAEVSHFTWWNCDVSMSAAKAIVTVFGADSGTALVKARTTANIGFRPNTVDTVLSVGVSSSPLNIPSNGEVCFWAEINFDNGSTGTTLEQCVSAGPNATVNIDLVSPISGPVNIVTTPAATANVLDVLAYENYPVQRVQVQTSTFETAVSYSIISGVLPAGLSLNTVSAVRAEIVGVPLSFGDYTVVIQADDGTSIDTVTINYTVTTDVPPPPPPIDVCGVDVLCLQ